MTKSREAFENSRTKRMDFTHDGYSYRSSEAQTEFEKFEDGYNIGRKQALEEAIAVFSSDDVKLAFSALSKAKAMIQELIK